MCCMSPCELVSFVTAIACSIAKCCNEEEIEILSAVFVQLGDTLATINVQKGICQESSEDQPDKCFHTCNSQEVTECDQ